MAQWLLVQWLQWLSMDRLVSGWWLSFDQLRWLSLHAVAPGLTIDSSGCRSINSRNCRSINCSGCRSIDSGGCRSSGSVAVVFQSFVQWLSFDRLRWLVSSFDRLRWLSLHAVAPGLTIDSSGCRSSGCSQLLYMSLLSPVVSVAVMPLWILITIKRKPCRKCTGVYREFAPDC